MQLISIQSHVVYGHVGNSAAVFPLQRLGCEVWPIHTVQLSNHTGYGGWTGQAFEAALIRELVDGIVARGVVRSCDGVISGYIGTPDIGTAILETVAKVKSINPQARYCCDPVIGNAGRGVFVRAGVAEFMRDAAIRAADVVTPNQFELDCLTGRVSETLPDLCAAIEELHALGPRAILVTSVRTRDTPSDAIDLVASDGRDRLRLRTPKLPVAADGAGDLTAGLFFFHLLAKGSLARALENAAASVFGVIRRTADANAREILLIEAQEEIVNPSMRFAAEII